MDRLHTRHPYTSVCFPNTAEYNCDVGYTLDHDPHGLKQFTITCEGNASFTGYKDCVPVLCGQCPRADHAEKYAHSVPVEENDRYFMNTCNYMCDTGYTHDQQAQGGKSHAIQCLATGEFTEPTACLPVSCGNPLRWDNTNLEGPFAAEDTVVFPQTVEYKCEVGYTFDQMAAGPSEFTVECQANGLFSERSVCLPVLCGVPHHTDNAAYNPMELHYKQTVTYTCDYGYTLSGEAGTTAQETIRCGSDAQYEKEAPVCTPVRCGTAPTIDKGSLTSHETSAIINFASDAVVFTCDPGWSTSTKDTAWTPYDSNTLQIACQADGTFETPQTCKNINDCQFVNCGDNGRCIDKRDPTGVHFDDYRCHCDSGYETTLHGSMHREDEQTKKCTNINDCPVPLIDNCGGLNARTQRRGVCVDLINDYDCVPQPGYETTLMPALPQNKTVTPKYCGQTPQLDFMTTDVAGQQRNFDDEQWLYTCDSGYALNGEASGPKTWWMRCQSNGMYTTARICHPVTCGPPPVVKHSDMSPARQEIFFPQKETFTCEEGYATDSQADGVKDFEIECQDDGTQTSPLSCLPVECGHVPSHDHATWDESKIFVYLEKAKVKCNEGYSLDQTMSPAAKWYLLSCESDGTYEETKTCKNVKCGAPPEVQHSTRADDVLFYLDKVEYTLDRGYTLNQQPDGPNTFEIECKSDATFSATKEPKPVTCNAAPARNHAVTSNAEYTFQQKALYTCLNGYSTDGVADGPKTFELECQHDGTYDGLDGCKPVECGSVQTPSSTEQIDDDSGSRHSELHYGQHSTFKCLPGYSTDAVLYSNLVVGKVICEANGDLTYPPECLNQDDCASPENLCAQNGKCKDLEAPMGMHMLDLTCECDSGFAHDTSAKSHYCYNIDDCPEGACMPGTCEDLINDYKCHCPDGYYEDANTEEDLPHDCLPNLCGPPNSVEHATTEETSDIYFDDAPVDYKCNEGYTLDGSADGEREFQLSCQADKSFQSPPECIAVLCGEVPNVAFAQFPAGTVLRFPETVHYECEEGYSTDQTYMGSFLQSEKPHHAKSQHLAEAKAEHLAHGRNKAAALHAAQHVLSQHSHVAHGAHKAENTEFSSECQADGTFTKVEQCKPIKCQEVPSQDHVTTDVAGTGLVYPNFLDQTCAVGHALHEDQHDETSYTITCASNGELEYSYKNGGCRAISCGSLPAPDNAKVTGSDLFGESAKSVCNEGHSVTQSCLKSDAQYEFTCLSSGSFAAHPDCLRVQCGTPFDLEHATHSTGSFYYQDQVDYTADEGYTLTGQANGGRMFRLTCEADCKYSGKQMFLPVECGAPPDLKKSMHPGVHRVFSQQEPYSCKGGYTTDGQAKGPGKFMLECAATGEYEGPEGCEPVQCGDVVTPPNCEHLGPTPTLVFQDMAFFDCNPGYSVNGKAGGSSEFETFCMADGSQTKHEGCKNKDDCEGHKCGPNGKCVDHDKPTGKHMDDYHCECDSGFEEEIEDGHKVCGNVPDCPEGACLPGSCEDLVNDYKCHCPEGYYEAENPDRELAHDCLPEPCGHPTTVEHATTSSAGEDQFFNSDPVEYSCDAGYTLDGAASGEKTFFLTCQANGNFISPPTCHPVRCGNAPHVASAEFDSSKAFVFPEKAGYTCDHGYTTDGTAAGPTSFEGECEDTGEITGVLTCEPVECPEVPEQENAEYAEGTNLVFPMTLEVRCAAGFALDEHRHDEGTYTISCTAGGELSFTNDAGCHPINCGPLPQVSHADVEGGTKFEEEATVTCHAGYSTDATPSEQSLSYPLTCTTTGDFTPTQKCDPISCGAVPHVEHSMNSHDGETAYYAEDPPFYGCDSGYTTTGVAGESAEWTITCQEDGSFSKTEVCLPISCGEPPELEHSVAVGEEYVFPQSAPYTCVTGFSVDGTPTGAKSFQADCTTKGRYDTPKGCAPIACGAVKVVDDSVQVEDHDGNKLSKLHFGQVAKFECKGGYSKDGMLGSSLVGIAATCQPDGTILYPSKCINNNDCLSPENACNPNGHCEDHKVATGVHADDFSCECDSGFTPETRDGGIKYCKNIPDCPDGACEPGSCEDLVNDYECHCPAGYFEGENPTESLLHDCLPKECGSPPSVDHAAVQNPSGSVFFDSAPVEYGCAEGYTLGGDAEGETGFVVSCLDTGIFAEPPTCDPVRCFSPPVVKNGKSSTKNELTFSETVTYTCDDGYSSDSGLDKDKLSFTATCGQEGFFTDVLACEKIRCPANVPEQENADVFEHGETLLFGEVADVVCLKGFSLSEEDRSKTSSSIECLATGDLKLPEHPCQAIDCKASGHAGKTPEVAHAKISGSTLFGEDLIATANEGYTLDGTAGGENSFYMTCESSGDFGPEPFPEFQRVQCDLPQYKNVDSMEVVDVPVDMLNLAQIRSRGNVSAHAHVVKQQKRRTPDPRYGDVVQYTCAEGYRASTADMSDAESDPVDFFLRCGASGDMENIEDPNALVMCSPVSYEVEDGAGNDFVLHSGHKCQGEAIETLDASSQECAQKCREMPDCAGFHRINSGSSDGKNGRCKFKTSVRPKRHSGDQRDCFVKHTGVKRMAQFSKDEKIPLFKTYQQIQEYTCFAGYSVDGTPDGAVEFDEHVTADGEMTEEHDCQDIDWCTNHKCGDNGSCHDDLLTYHCECNDGFQLDVIDGDFETCVQVDECETQSGDTYCDGGKEMGVCIDETLAYKCQCNEGYENPEAGAGTDSCIPVTCGSAPLVEHATPTSQPKLTYLDHMDYFCESGYTLDGTASGHITFKIDCQADESYAGVEECHPVECGSTASVEHATKDVDSLVYPEFATYECDAGYTVTGTAAGSAEFEVECSAEGTLTAPFECMPILCGVAPLVPHAQATQDKIFFEGEATYHCAHGYTTTGETDGDVEFTVTCGDDGQFSQGKSCHPLQCGLAPKVKHGEMPLFEFEFPQQFEVVCHTGFTVDEDPDGESSFVVKCGSDGEFSGMKECKRVKCGEPQPTTNAKPASSDSLFFEDVANWECNNGYTVDGTKQGGTKFVKQCQATGSFGKSSPSDCKDINYCVGEPCTANGECVDDGDGIPAPGYKCQCFDGFEVTTREDGSEKCKEDDCDGDPCGTGGTCTDLSATGAPEGMYKCECDAGYNLIEPEPGKPTCNRVECGSLLNLKHVEQTLDAKPLLDVKTFYANEPEIDVLYGTPILMSFDAATYTCAEGYSTDGTTHHESMDFRVLCEGSGLFAPPISVDAAFCVPVECDNTFIPEVSHTFIPAHADGIDKYHYGESLTFQCQEGYTLGGQVGGEKEFSLDCEANGLFTEEHPACTPVECAVPEHTNAISSASGSIRFGQAVTYTCQEGHYLNGAVSVHNRVFGGECKADGTIDLDAANPNCLPCNCGPVNSDINSVPLKVSEDFFMDFLQTEGTSPGTRMLEHAHKHSSPLDHKHSSHMIAQKRKAHRKAVKSAKARKGKNSQPEEWQNDGFEIIDNSESLVFGESSIIVCNPGTTVAGQPEGIDFYEKACGAEGDYDPGVPVHGLCKAPEYTVLGEVVNAQNGRDKIGEATVTFAKDGVSTTVQSNAQGRYSINVQAGEYVVTASKADWIDREKPVDVKHNMKRGQGADLAMSKILPPGGFRVVLNWAAHSRDLDSWTYFDDNFGKYVYYGRPRIQGPTSGVNVALDWDDVDGHGPETSTYLGLGHCESSCLIKFHVDNYSYRDAHLSDSEGVVTVYEGNGVKARYNIPSDIGEDRGWTVFTLDASDLQIYEGDWIYAPFIKKHNGMAASTNWAGSMDYEGWSRVPTGSVLYGMSSYSINTKLAKVGTAYYYIVQNTLTPPTVTQVDWTGILAEGRTAMCPEGSWISALYRSGSQDTPPRGPHQIVKAECSAFKDVESWGDCVGVDSFQERGQDSARCPDVDGVAYAMVGLHHKGTGNNGQSKLKHLDTIKCCRFPKRLVKEPTSKLCIATQTCTDLMGKQ